MHNGEKKFIYILLIIIIVLSLILILKILFTPDVDQKLYNEIYSEYENFSKIDNTTNDNFDMSISDNNTRESIKESKKIYMYSNSNGSNYRVIGGIIIPKIKVNYPIIYKTTDEYLKIAPTKLLGPNVNEVGNLCIVGHNYHNNQFFSKLSELEIDDKVFIKSNSGKVLTYLVYDIFEVDESNFDCTSQNTNGNIEATLITCTAQKQKRLVVKCKVS